MELELIIFLAGKIQNKKLTAISGESSEAP
jgi:hypothetical protein